MLAKKRKEDCFTLGGDIINSVIMKKKVEVSFGKNSIQWLTNSTTRHIYKGNKTSMSRR